MLEAIFTKQERQALAFLLAVGFLGLGIRACQKFQAAGKPAESFVSLRVAVNRANEAELVALPGIGPVTARRILEERRRGGRFVTARDLLRVKGISAKTLEKIHRLVTFD
ncbi:MAG: helix-hairpin-helix domain-containing protein [Candidatus Omnitrophica bacterium]|nr:helix-hairpin-helix domain-containing protein [Candidatus Omnitrophota bacterium]